MREELREFKEEWPTYTRERKRGFILIVLVDLICVLGVIATFWWIGQGDAQRYNKGICVECGGNLEYHTTIGHSSYIEYVYKCDTCNFYLRSESFFK